MEKEKGKSVEETGATEKHASYYQAHEGETYECPRCKKDVSVVPKTIVIMTITDHSGTIKVVAIEDIVEQILKIAPAGMTSQTRQEKPHDSQMIKEQFADKFFLILLRRKFGKTNDDQRRHLLTSYYDETDPTTDRSPPATKRNFNRTKGTSKKQ